MRVLVAHNYYQQRGGEDQVFESECSLLREHGVEVEQFSVHNDEIGDKGKLKTFTNAIWNGEVQTAIENQLDAFSPDLVHFHNTWPIISPAAHYACKRFGAKVVQTLHNYRMICPAATLYRNGELCTTCSRNFFAWPGVLNRCYRGDLGASAAIAMSYSSHRALGTWRNQVDLFLALSAFQKQLLTAAGLPEPAVKIKPNFLPEDPGMGNGAGGYVLFAGRLVEEKGIRTAVRVWQEGDLPAPLYIAGDGPLKDELETQTSECSNIRWLGFQSKAELKKLTQDALLALAPSEWPEPFGLVAIEALACGTPVAAARSGALPEIVVDGDNGILFEPRQSGELRQKVHSLLENDRLGREMRKAARETYLDKYTAQLNAKLLLKYYEETLS